MTRLTSSDYAAPAAQPRLLTTRQLADYLAVSPGTVRRMAARGELPKPLRLAGLVRWDRAGIDRLLDERLGQAPRYDDPDEAIVRLADARRQDRAAQAR